jgi:hypothetical protein
MLARGGCTDSQLRHALEDQRLHAGRRIGECLQQLGYARETQVTAALAMQWCCPVITMLPQQLPECGVPRSLLRRFQMLPVHFSEISRTLHLAFAGPVEYPALVAVEQMLDCKTEACLTTASALQSGLEHMEINPASSEKEFVGARGPEEMTRIVSSYTARLSADRVRAVTCGELAWVRLEGGESFMNLLFQLPG